MDEAALSEAQRQEEEDEQLSNFEQIVETELEEEGLQDANLVRRRWKRKRWHGSP